MSRSPLCRAWLGAILLSSGCGAPVAYEPSTPNAQVPLVVRSEDAHRAEIPLRRAVRNDDAARAATTQATARLRALLEALAKRRGFAFGNEDSTAYGIGWSGAPNLSDVERVCGVPPAVYGWDLFGIELGRKQNGDGVDFEVLCERMRAANRIGAINTVSWHAYNPVTSGNAWDRTPAVAAILPGGAAHDRFRASLDRVADFFDGCRGEHGERLPLVFRPFHEGSGNWFWWGAAQCSEEQYVDLFRFTIDYLRQTRDESQLLVAYSPDGISCSFGARLPATLPGGRLRGRARARLLFR
ncbi:MAG: glycosyl hydrolase [Polyangiaceae bacterium]